MGIPPAHPPTPFTYRVAGLSLGSTIPLPRLEPLPPRRPAGEPVLSLHLATPDEAPENGDAWFRSTALPDGAPWLSCAKHRDGFLLRFHGLADFVTDRKGHLVLCRPRPDLPPDTLEHLFLNQALPLVLSLRGLYALHATAVLTPVGVCAFAGPAGSGKSTLAAGFARAGFPSISDDCLVLREEGGRLLAVPAWPGLRLWDDALAALGPPGPASPVAHYSSKRQVRWPGSGDFPREPLPLAGLFCLRLDRSGPRRDPLIEPLGPRAAFLELLEGLFTLDITDRRVLVEQCRFAARLLEAVPVRRLSLPADFSALPQARALVLRTLGEGR